MNSSKVLITGAAGFIGSLLCQYLLQNGFKVFAIDELIYNNGDALNHVLGDQNFKFRKANCLIVDSFKDWIEKSDIIIPLAAIVGAPACDKSPSEALLTNQEAIFNLLNLLSPSQHVIFPCTNSSYGRNELPCTETTTINPISLYAQTKCNAEKFVLNKQNSTSFRLATVFGTSLRPRFDLLVNYMFSEIYYKAEITLFESKFRRNYVHIRDVIRAFGHAIYYPEKYHGVFNVGLPSANLTKEGLAVQIIKYLGFGKIAYAEGTDTDQRDYFVSNEKILANGFTFKHDLNHGFKELETFCSYHKYEQIKQMRYGG